MLKARFNRFFKPLCKLVIDESLVLFKGRLKFKQYMQTKWNRFGIKLFILCDCETGIVLDFLPYTASNIDFNRNDIHESTGNIIKMVDGWVVDGWMGG